MIFFMCELEGTPTPNPQFRKLMLFAVELLVLLLKDNTVVVSISFSTATP